MISTSRPATERLLQSYYLDAVLWNEKIGPNSASGLLLIARRNAISRSVSPV